MKLLSLTLHNIASYADAAINFTTEPLASADIFLISGETGSGKSMVLDAICLALYGTTPRLAQSVAATDNDEMTLRDPRRMLSENCGEGFISLRFHAQGRDFTSRWSVQRAHKRPGAKLQKQDWILTDEKTGHTLTRIREVEKRIVELIGLDFAQFTRTTMLSQGDFAAFLKSKGEEKAMLLQKITGIDKFEKIGKRIFETVSTLRHEYEAAEETFTRMVADVLSAEEHLRLSNREALLAARVDRIGVLTQQYTHTLNWIDTLTNLTQNLQKAENDHFKALQVVNDPEFANREKELGLYDNTEDVRHQMRIRAEAESCIARLNDDMTALRDSFARILHRMQKQQTDLCALNDELSALLRKIERQTEYHETFAKVESILADLENLAKWQSERPAFCEKIAETNSSLRDILLPDLQKKRDAAEKQRQATELYMALSKEAEANTDREGLKSLRLQRENLEHRLQTIDEALRKMAAIQTLWYERKQLFRENGIACCHRTAQSALAGIYDRVHTAFTSRVQLAQAKRDAFHLAAQDATEAIRATLQMGDECPVCGNIVTGPLPIVSALRRRLENADARLLEEKLRAALALKHKEMAAAESRSYEKEMSRLDTAIEESSLRLAREVKEYKVMLSTHEVSTKALSDLKVTYLHELKTATTEISRLEELQNESMVRTKRVAKALDLLDKMRKKASIAEEKATAAKAEITNAQSALDIMNQNMSYAATRIRQNLGSYPLPPDGFEKSPVAFGEKIAADAAKYSEMLKRRDDLQTQIANISDELTDCQGLVSDILSMQPEWNGTEPVTQLKKEAKEAKSGLPRCLTSLHTDIKSIIKQLGDADIKLNDAQKEIDSFVCSNPDTDLTSVAEVAKLTHYEVQALRKRISEARKNLQNLEGGMSNAREALEKHKTTRPTRLADTTDIQDTRNRYKDKVEKANTLSQSIALQRGKIASRLADNGLRANRLDDCRQKRDAALMALRAHEPLCALIGDSTGKKFRNVALSYMLATLVEGANRYMSLFTDRYTLEVEPGTFIINVVDAYQNFAKRTSNTISGGETFLVSLALALSLSDIGELTGCDTLFIDEGFGSLSGPLLTRAVETLRTLHRTSGRRVGIISHIPALREGIPVQLHVSRNLNNFTSQIDIFS